MAALYRSSLFVAMGIQNFGKDAFLKKAKKAKEFIDTSVMERDLTGQHCMVTGANQGIGLEAATQLAKRGATVAMVCRDEARGKAAVDLVQESTGNKNVKLWVCDLGSLEAVKKLAADYTYSMAPLHTLVNNAGLLIDHKHGPDGKSADGREINFAVNTLGTFALTRLLQPVLKTSAPARVITVSSGGMYTQPLLLEDMQSERHKTVDGSVAYGRDKRRQVALAEHMSKRWAEDGIVCVTMHPGWTETAGVKKSIPGFYNAFKNKFRNLEQGADTIVWLAAVDQEALQPGGFYLDRTPQTKHLAWAGTKYSEQKVAELYDILSEQAGLPKE